MTKDELEINADKISHLAWGSLKRKILFFGSAIILILGYFGFDSYVSRMALKKELEKAQTDAAEVAKAKKQIHEVKIELDDNVKYAQDLQQKLIMEQERVRTDLRDLSQSFKSLISDLRTIPNDIAPGLDGKLEAKEKEIQEQLASLDLSFCKFGIKSLNSEAWPEKLFQSESGETDESVPTEGSILRSSVDINIRSGFPNHQPGKGLFFRPTVGYLKAGERIVVKEVRAFQLKDSIHYWISYIPTDR